MRFLLLMLTFVLCSCAQVVLKQPQGTRKETELSKLTGTWRAGEDAVANVSVVPGDHPLKISITNEKEVQELRGLITEIDDVEGEEDSKISLLWIYDEDLKAYMPFRVSFQDDAVVCFLIPDDKEIQKMLDAGLLKGRVVDRNYHLEPEGVVRELAGKRFWQLSSLPFVKIPASS